MSIDVVLKILSGGLIPSAAIIIFNILNHVFDHLGEKALPDLPESAFDISVGCAFTIFGIGVSAKEHAKSNETLVLFAILLLIIIVVELIMPTFKFLAKFDAVLLINFVSFASLCYALSEAG